MLIGITLTQTNNPKSPLIKLILSFLVLNLFYQSSSMPFVFVHTHTNK